MIKIFQAEMDAGLEEQIKSNASIAYTNVAESIDIHPDVVLDELVSSRANLHNNKFLHGIKTILVTTGWNKNDDVFSPNEVWKARHTPEDTPFNFQHNESDIIGHIISDQVLDAKHEIVPDETETKNLPDLFHIATVAVLYQHWENNEAKQRMDKILKEIPENKWFVSMECIFAGFDYAVIDGDGNHKTIARTADSAFLTKHLRAYGGTGIYNDYQIGRIMRNITFLGKGLVSNPANPNSIIFADFNSKKEISVNELPKEEKSSMADEHVLQSQINELKSSLTAIAQERDALNKQILDYDAEAVAKEHKTLADKISVHETTIADLNTAVDKLNDKVESSTSNLKDVENALAEVEKERDNMKSDIVNQARSNMLVDAGKSREEADVLVAKFNDISDEAFTEVVNLAQATKSADTDTTDSTDVTDDVDNDVTENVNVNANTDVLDDVDVVDDTTDTAAANDGTEDVRETTVAAMADYIGGFLNTSSNNSEE